MVQTSSPVSKFSLFTADELSVLSGTPSASSAEYGKSGSGGGMNGSVGGVSFAGFPSSRPTLVKLFVGTRDDIVKTRCCGIIGKNSKWCTQPVGRCTVASHRRATFDPPHITSGDHDRLIFLQAPNKEGEGSRAFIDPVLAASQVEPATLKDHANASHSVDYWLHWFESVKSIAPDDPKAEKFFQDIKNYPSDAFTPRKRNKFASLSSTPLDDFLDSVPPTVSELPEDVASGYSILRPNWVLIVQKLDNLSDLLKGTHDHLRAFQDAVEHDITSHGITIDGLKKVLGTRPDVGGADSVWNSLMELHQSSTPDLAPLVTPLVDTALAAGMPPLVAPLVDKALESSMTSVKDLFTNFSGRLRHLEATPSPGSPLSPSSDDIGLLKAKISKLEDALDLTKSEMHEKRYTVAGRTFASRRHIAGFLAEHAADDKFGLFFDAVSLMAVSSHDMESDLEELRFDDYSGKRSEYSSTNDAVYVLSFRKELPTIFGKVPASGVAKNSRILPGLGSFADWDTRLGVDGARHVLHHNIKQTEPSLRETIRFLSPEAREIALELLSRSVVFVSSLSQWITNFYTELRTASSAGDAECWRLTSHAVRTVFRDLAEVRSVAKRLGGVLTPVQKASYYVWATLQAHRIMDEYLARDFKNHPSIAPMLNQHLFECRVPLTVFQSLQREHSQLKTQLAEVRAVADRARQAAESAKRGNHRGKGNVAPNDSA